MESQVLDQLQTTLAAQGSGAALDKLCAELQARKEYAALFYTLLMKKRVELGVAHRHRLQPGPAPRDA
jgi:hypothetical protein